MKDKPKKKIAPAKELSVLAMEFRGTRDKAQRELISEKYRRVLDQFISSKSWRGVLPLEDQLPDEEMPRSFFEWLDSTAAESPKSTS